MNPFGPPASPRDKGPASLYPCLAVATGHVKHAQGPHEPTYPTHGAFNVTAAAPSPNHLYLPAHHTPHGLSLPTEAPIAYPPHAYTTAPRSLCQHNLTHGPSKPIITVHGIDAVLPGLHTHDEATHTGSLSSREGNPTYWIPPPANGVQYPGQPGCISRQVRPITALHGSSRTRSH